MLVLDQWFVLRTEDLMQHPEAILEETQHLAPVPAGMMVEEDEPAWEIAQLFPTGRDGEWR